ncbi:hypothetical protein [Micromonospora siamensis]|nr:hypothetical protein [Micromonospora siamensis]
MTAVLERDGITGPHYTTEPYEVAWAREARWFLRVLDLPAGVSGFDCTVQVSPDGLNWVDLDEPATSVDAAGLVTWVSREFGGWLRLRATVHGDSAGTQVPTLIYLALKA